MQQTVNFHFKERREELLALSLLPYSNLLTLAYNNALYYSFKEKKNEINKYNNKGFLSAPPPTAELSLSIWDQ